MRSSAQRWADCRNNLTPRSAISTNLNQTRGMMSNLRFVLLFGAFVLSLPTISYGQSPASQNGAPLRVAIAGLVHGHAEGFLQANLHRPDIELVGIAEPDQKVAAKYAAQFHMDHALMFASLDEMLEKPLAVSLEDALAMQQAASKAKIPVLVNYETTWYRSNHAAYDLVHQNALGEVRKVVVHDGHRGPKEIGVQPEFLTWLTDPKLDGAGALFDFGCYGADLVTWLMDGRRPTAVTAVVQQIKPDVYPKVDDEATIVLTYPHAQAIVQASWNWPFDRKDMEVYGQTGYAITVARDQLRVRRAGGEEERITAPPIPPPDDDPINYLRSVVLGGLKPQGLSSLDTNVVVMEILDAARQSAASGKTIELAPGK